MIQVSKPHVPNRKVLFDLINSACDRSYFSNFGPLQERLNEALCEHLGTENLVLTASATQGLEVAVASLMAGKKTTHIYTTPYSFKATSSAITANGKTPKYVDIGQNQVCSDFSEVNLNGAFVLDTHVYGIPSSLINEKSYMKPQTVFDAAHCFDVHIDGNHISKFGCSSVLSFHATKMFHTCEGGAVICNKVGQAEEIKDRISFSLKNDKITTFTNAKMSELHAAMGLANLLEISEITERRQQMAEIYAQIVSEYSGPLLKIIQTASVSYFPVKFSTKKMAANFQQKMNEQNIVTRLYFDKSLNEIFSNDICVNSEELVGKIVCLPMSSQFSDDEIMHIKNTLRIVLDDLH